MSEPVCIWPLGAVLGEGPVWSATEQALYFVDIKGRQVHRCDAEGGARRSLAMPDETGFALPVRGGGLVCGLPGRVVYASLEGDLPGLAPLATLEADLPGNRLNDGAIDRHGKLWFGSMDNAETAPTGSLYTLDGQGGGVPQRLAGGCVITNGPAFSPDGRTFYHTDTLEKTIYAYDLAGQNSLSNKRVFVRIAGSGYPDGTTVDADGTVWVALFGGARIERYTPAGQLLGSIAMPCSNITKIAFGGDDLRTVFVTTARKGLTVDQLAQQPLAGGLFSFRAGSAGQAPAQFDRTMP
jgi:sugar lactone lactonase YvrE